jgi:hypothetical protein
VATEKADTTPAPPAPTVAAAPSATAVGAKEQKKAMPRSKGQKGNAACGAGTCSDEMKK